MPSEAGFQISNKVGDAIVLLRGDTYEEFIANGVAAGLEAEHLGKLFSRAFGGDTAQAGAVANVVHAFPGTVPVPGPVAAPAAAVPPPPTAGYPGDCIHGQRSFKSSTTSRGPWNRWDCASPWVKGNDAHNNARCKAINA